MKFLGKVVDDISEFDQYIKETDSIPEVVRMNGIDISGNRNQTSWITYPTLGSLSIMVRLSENPVLYRMVERIKPLIENLLPSNHIFIPAHVTMIRTIGSIRPHIDEVSQSSIHIGLKNSSKSTTSFYEDGIAIDSFRIEEGHAYTFNGKRKHGVTGDPTIIRYFIAYRVKMDYLDFISYLNTKNSS